MKVTIHNLASFLSDLLNLPKGRLHTTDKSHIAVRAVFQTIKDALLRGESVSIPGFGIFKVRTQPPLKKGVSYFLKPGSRPYYVESIVIPSKQYIFFEPSKVLIRFINTPTNQGL